ncbi:MAG TPA: hypothetical protein VGN12_06910 [Pirellulales bacterium]
MSVFIDAAAAEDISREAYFLLEQHLQGLRLMVMHVSANFARHENPYQGVTRNHVHKALEIVAQKGLNLRIDDDEPIGDFPQDTYIYLEKRLHNLRLFVIRSAAAIAKPAGASTTAEPRRIAAQHIESAWNELADAYSILRSVLVADSATAA